VSAPRYDGWVPFRIYFAGGQPWVEWCFMGSNRFSDPFFATTMFFELQTPFNTLFRQHTPMSELERWRRESPGLEPAGFIFHGSRCGSTLITRLLATSPEHLVLSEPEPLDAMARSHVRAPAATAEQRIEWLRCLLSALAQPRGGTERRLFVKFDPSEVFAIPLLRQAFPGVPWIFVYREPVEVLVSHQRAAATFLVPGLLGWETPGVDPAAAVTMREDEYMARVLGGILAQAAGQLPDPQAMLVNYRELPEAIWGRIGRHFGFEFSSGELEDLRVAAEADAKRPGRKFEPDSTSKHAEATDRTRALADAWIGPAYAKLETARSVMFRT